MADARLTKGEVLDVEAFLPCATQAIGAWDHACAPTFLHLQAVGPPGLPMTSPCEPANGQHRPAPRGMGKVEAPHHAALSRTGQICDITS